MNLKLICPKCGCDLKINDFSLTATSWGICPQCQYADFIIAAELETYNLSVNSAVRQMERGNETLPVEVSLRTLYSIQAAMTARRRIGKLGGWTNQQFEEISCRLCGPGLVSVKTPPFLCIDTRFREAMKPYMFPASRRDPEPKIIAGLNIPLFQEQNQYVGHCTLIKPYPDACSGFSWKTYMHEFYEDRERAFLSYRPAPVTEDAELLIVDNFTAYIQIVKWFDTTLREPSEAFPGNVVPVLLLGKKQEALTFLKDHVWRPFRITVVSPFRDISSHIWEEMQADSFLGCPKLRVAADIPAATACMHRCRSRERFEDLILEKFFELNGEKYDHSRRKRSSEPYYDRAES